MATTIPDMGIHLKYWRERKNLTHQGWADHLFQAGIRPVADSHQLAKDLQQMEDHNVWPYAGPASDALSFAKQCKDVIAQQDWEHVTADELIYCIARFIYAPLGILVTPPPYANGQTP